MVIVCFLLCCVASFAVVFIKLDQSQTDIANGEDEEKTMVWITCIAKSGGDRTKCYSSASDFIVNETTIVAILLLLSVGNQETKRACFIPLHSY